MPTHCVTPWHEYRLRAWRRPRSPRIGAIPIWIVSGLLVGGRLIEGIAVGKAGMPRFADVALAAAVLTELHVAGMVHSAGDIRDLHARGEDVDVHGTRPELRRIGGSERVDVVSQTDLQLVSWREVQILKMKHQQLGAPRLWRWRGIKDSGARADRQRGARTWMVPVICDMIPSPL